MYPTLFWDDGPNGAVSELLWSAARAFLTGRSEAAVDDGGGSVGEVSEGGWRGWEKNWTDIKLNKCMYSQ
jgi:hypothetical protein